jgi:hypothetical protein
MTTREEHMTWCKRRALQYVDAGDPDQALQSMLSDLGKHPETANHGAIKLTMILLLTDNLSGAQAIRKPGGMAAN